MKRKHLLLLLLLVVLATLLACSNSEEKKTKQTSNDSISQQLGKQAVKAIKTPIDKAKMAQKLEEEHNREVQENLKHQ